MPYATIVLLYNFDSSDHCLYFFLEETGDLDREAWTLDREAGALDREAGALDREAGTFLACFLFTGIARHCYELLQATPAGSHCLKNCLLRTRPCITVNPRILHWSNSDGYGRIVDGRK